MTVPAGDGRVAAAADAMEALDGGRTNLYRKSWEELARAALVESEAREREAREIIEAFVAWFSEHDGKADDFGRLREVVRAEDFLASLAGVIEAEPDGSTDA